MPKLTDIYGEADRLARETAPGMAHWAGTGPAGATCKTCAELKPGGKPNMGQCRRWRRAYPKGKWLSFNATTPACKWWEKKGG